MVRTYIADDWPLNVVVCAGVWPMILLWLLAIVFLLLPGYDVPLSARPAVVGSRYRLFLNLLGPREARLAPPRADRLSTASM